MLKCGIVIESIEPESPAEKAGLHPDDILLSVNGKPLHDAIDFMFYKNNGMLDIEFKRNDVRHSVRINNADNQDPGLTIKPFKVRVCRNNCIFCFVKQLPKGLRKQLYLKDEDYRLSFLYGNYITLSNIELRDKKRIIEQRLSPLYVSVHSTNKSLRNKMLGNSKLPDIMKELKYFSGHKIRMHLQIVLCPGYNDGKELENTIKDLYKFYPYTSSIAVVPVGLTRHRKIPVNPVTGEDAIKAIRTVEVFQKRYIKKHGDPVVYCADEMYIKAGLPFPKLSEYGALPQLENGVGMVPLFMNQSKKIRMPKSVSHKKKFLAITGTSFFPFLKRFTDRLFRKENIHIDVIPVENRLFGQSVTVTGLLTGRDIITALHDNTDAHDVLIVPDSALKEDEDIFLDDVSLKDIQEATGLKAIRTEASPQGLIDTMANHQ